MHATHTAVTVSDLEATTDFYEGVLGLEYQREFTGDDGVVNYYVGTDDGASLQFKFDPNADGAVDPSGIDHLAFSVEDVDATFERVLEESGCDVHLEPTTFDAANRRAAFVYDPDGYVVEFVQPI
jgi:lactoylglutathione lyase